jgi:hypothetical protein
VFKTLFGIQNILNPKKNEESKGHFALSMQPMQMLFVKFWWEILGKALKFVRILSVASIVYSTFNSPHLNNFLQLKKEQPLNHLLNRKGYFWNIK